MGYSAPDLGAALRLCAFTHTLIQYCTATTLNTWERGAARVEKAEVVFFFFFRYLLPNSATPILALHSRMALARYHPTLRLVRRMAQELCIEQTRRQSLSHLY